MVYLAWVNTTKYDDDPTGEKHTVFKTCKTISLTTIAARPRPLRPVKAEPPQHAVVHSHPVNPSRCKPPHDDSVQSQGISTPFRVWATNCYNCNDFSDSITACLSTMSPSSPSSAERPSAAVALAQDKSDVSRESDDRAWTSIATESADVLSFFSFFVALEPELDAFDSAEYSPQRVLGLSPPASSRDSTRYSMLIRTTLVPNA